MKGHAAVTPDELLNDIIKNGVWLPLSLLDVLPVLRPYTIRDRTCRPDHRKAQPGDDLWGSPNQYGFCRDDNSLIKGMPYLYPVLGCGHPLDGKRIERGYTASHAWRSLSSGGTSHANHLTYSFIGNLVWLPKSLAWRTDQENGFGQRILKSLSHAIYKTYPYNMAAEPIMQTVWSELDILSEETVVLPEDIVKHISFFKIPVIEFAEKHFKLMEKIVERIDLLKLDPEAQYGKIRSGRLSMPGRYSRGLASIYRNDDGLKSLRQAIASSLALRNQPLLETL